MAGTYNITIEQGSDTNDLEVTPKNDDETPISLDGFTARMQIRPNKNSSIINDNLTTENSRLVISSFDVDDETFWKVSIKFPSATTTAYDFVLGVYDLEVVSSTGVVERLIEGSVTVNKEVTK